MKILRESFFVPSSGTPSAAFNASLILDDERGELIKILEELHQQVF